MKKQVSSLNTIWLIQYLKDHYPEINLDEMMEKVHADEGYYVRNIKTHMREKIAVKHLTHPDYWFSNLFMMRLYDVVQKTVPDPLLGYDIGRTFIKSQSILKTAVGIPILGPVGLLKTMARENKKYNRTKENALLKMEKGHAIIRVIHHENVIINKFAMDWHRGVFESYGRFAGATDVVVTSKCIEKGPEKIGDQGNAIWEFDIRYTYHNLFVRVFYSLLYRIPSVGSVIENANRVQEEHNEQILNRDQIIKDQTEKLKKIQDSIFDAERKSIEQKIRNISTELATAEERERRLIAEDLHDSVCQSLAISLSKIKNLDARKMDPAGAGELQAIETELEKAAQELRSLTFQISPPVLYNMGLEAALKWLIKEINTTHQMEIGFSSMISGEPDLNDTVKMILYRSVRELIINILKHADTKKAQVTLSVFEDQFVISVEDSGKGFDTQILNAVDRSGFGVFSILERIKALGGDVEIDSKAGKGTNTMLLVPISEKAH